jgi:DNA-binding beta-propeller fold protein YncE
MCLRVTIMKRKALPLALWTGLAMFLPTIALAQAFVTQWGSFGYTAPGLFNNCSGVAVDDAGNVFVADVGNHRIQKFTDSGVFLMTWGAYGSGPGQFASAGAVGVDPAGNVYVLDSGDLYHSSRIQKFDGNGGLITSWGTLTFNEPHGIAIDRTGYVYVADTFNDRIVKFTDAGLYVSAWGSHGTAAGQFIGPYSITVDPTGSVYVAEIVGNRIQKFTGDGVFLAQWGSYGSGSGQVKSPQGVAADRFGNVYVSDSGNNRIEKFTQTGSFVTQWGSYGLYPTPGVFYNPIGICTDSYGKIYVADFYNDRIEKFGVGPVPVSQPSWGHIKSLYR